MRQKLDEAGDDNQFRQLESQEEEFRAVNGSEEGYRPSRYTRKKVDKIFTNERDLKRDKRECTLNRKD